ncbi:nuclear transport factor 2 family protein [bacterium]|nr:MAG: nuclear transport factor 2 family protein [bacterium]
MSIKLPQPIENYFRHSEKGALKEASEAFALDATVIDEGEDSKAVGREAIHGWITEYTSKFKTTLEVVNLVEKDGEAVVTTLVSGDFPGSPAEFVYRFALRNDLIDRLVVEFVGFK